MKLARFPLVVAALWVGGFFASSVAFASPEDEVEAIFDRAVAKAQAGRNTEADLAAELNDLSDLHNKYRSHRALAAEILLARGQLYEKIIKDREMAMAIYIQVATEYPGTNAGALAALTIEAAMATADDEPPPRRATSNSERSSGSGSSTRNASGPSNRGNTGSNASNRSGNASRSGGGSSRASSAPEVGGMFPEFSIQDLDDIPHTLSQYRGQVVLVDFWATSCSECIDNTDSVMAAYRKYHAKGFEIIGIGMDRDRAPMKNFIRARTITWPQFFDEGGTLSHRLGVTAPGSSFLIDRTGKVIAVNLRGYALERALQKQFSN
jgi:peroxiredoxin